MRKQLTCLSTAILIYSSSTFAIPFQPGDNAILVLQSQAGAYWMDTGVSADDLAGEEGSRGLRNGTGFTLDITAASSALDGIIDSFALFGRSSSTEAPVYSYTEFIYVDPGSGIVYAQNDPSTQQSNFALIQQTDALSSYLATFDFGYQAASSQNYSTGSSLLSTTLGSGVWVDTQAIDEAVFYHHYQGTDDQTRQSQYLGYFGFKYYPTFNITQNGSQNTFRMLDVRELPIPGSAWLFLSAGTGLMLSRRLQR